MDVEGFLELLPDGALLVGPDGTIRFASTTIEGILGHPPSDVVGEAVETLIPEHQRELHRRARSEYGRAPTARAMERGLHILGRHRDGSAVPLAVSLTPLEHGGERVVLALVRDLTATRATELELLRSQRLETVGRLATGVAHDFNNLLTVITGGAGSVGEMLPPEHEGQEEIAAILEAARRATTLTRHLLAMGRRQARNIILVDVNDVIRATEHMLTRLLGERIRVELRLDEGLEPVLVDPDELGQVLLNLAVNAREAMPGGGVLTFETGSAPGYGPDGGRPRLEDAPAVELRIRDTGSGMEPEVRSRAFESFYTTKAHGTGLGLSTVRDIVERFGGEISLESEPGRGTEFRIRLPSAARLGHRYADAAGAAEGGEG